MEYYPQDLLVGVFPLVFAVDATTVGGGQHQQEEQHQFEAATTASGGGGAKRTLFDRFLDVVAASLVDVEDGSASDGGGGGGGKKRGPVPTLFRHGGGSVVLAGGGGTGTGGDAAIFADDESSDDEDFELGVLARRRSSSVSLSAGFYAGFGRRAINSHSNNQALASVVGGGGGGTSTAVNGGVGTTGGASTAAAGSYAKALTHGQGFFQRARIEAVSTRHGFPPSKDPDGTENLAYRLPQQHERSSPAKLTNFLAEERRRRGNSANPTGGIVTAGWLEKHVHALPSAILVVCTVSSNQKAQAEQDRRLLETIAHFRIGLVPKRRCRIHVVGIMQDDVSLHQGETWNRSISSDILEQDQQQQQHGDHYAEQDSGDLFFRVAMLRAAEDLHPDIGTGRPSSLAFRRLHQTVREASMVYYLSQARRTKEKLGKLLDMEMTITNQNLQQRSTTTDGSPRQPPPPLLPLVIRYCFKIAMFYEFQWKFEKSLRFMAEAYRYVSTYYEYLLSRPGSGCDDDNDGKGSSASGRMSPHHHGGRKGSAASVSDTGESFEVSLNDGSSFESDDEYIKLWEAIFPGQPPGDMLHQCRAVAEWLNLKLLQAGFASHTEGGLLAAANQWRQHCRLFCTRQHSDAIAASNAGGDWFEWTYITRQRLVMSQLVERHPPKALGDLGNDYDEVLLRCSPWRTYESAVEAMLRLAREVDLIQKQPDGISSESQYGGDSKDPMRARYVGGLDSEGLVPELREVCKANHRAKALEIALRAISLYEHESEKEKRGFYAEDNFSERSSSRAGARLYYLAGGILLGMKNHEAAVVHLEKAAKFSRGWRALEVAIRRMLIECYEKHFPTSTQSNTESNEAIASMILNSYFNADMSPRDLRRALGNFASRSDGGSLKWYHETVDEEDMSLPFSFAVSFPGRTHATAGDTVEASVLITSNLDYAVHVSSVMLLSLAGQLPIPPSDLLCASNASEGGEEGIIIQSKTSIIVSTHLELPKDTSIIAVDDSGNGGEMQGVAGKGSFAKSARPRTAGITSAGGARLLSQDETSHANRVSQGWSMKYLGGKPLRCDGIRLVLYPVQVEKATGSADTVTTIQLTIQKKKPKTQANIKRTPFEEENYIASAWSRPLHLPLSRGPRSLRVLGPMPELVITDMTEEVTGGKVVEGTVNRILLKFTAGQQERCCDIKYRVSCFSVLITPNGTTRRLVSTEELSRSEGALDMTNPTCRTPSLVKPSSDSPTPDSTKYGYSLPPGWELADSGQSFTGPSLSGMDGGESKFVDLNFYRPAPLIQSNSMHMEEDESNVGDVSLCKTDFYVTVSYRQERTVVQKKRMSNVRGRRRRPVPKAVDNSDDPSCAEPEEKVDDEKTTEPAFEEVSLEFTGSVVWGNALKASFRPGASKACPSGSRSQFNSVSRASRPTGDSTAEFMSLVEGNSATARCSFQADNAVEGLKTEILGIRFEDVDSSSQSPVSFSLLSRTSNNQLYTPEPGDPCRVLSIGSKLSIAYTVRPHITTAEPEAGSEGIKSTFGTILVDWKPSSLPLPDGVRLESDVSSSGIRGHGPLRLQTPSTTRFSGPACVIESSPFEAIVQSTAAQPRMGTPFVVNYRVKNKTNVHQNVSVRVTGPTPHHNDGLVFSGTTNGELSLAPSEMKTISYTILATRVGTVRLPSLEVSSQRYQSWIIKEPAGKEIVIFP